MTSGHFDAMLAAEAAILPSLEIRYSNNVPVVRPNCAWREKVSQWCYDVADHLNEDRSIVYVAMTILDRYCETFTTLMNEKQYEISSLSAIFLAIHIAGSGDLTLQELISMSRGGIAVKDIIGEATTIADAITLSEPILTPVDFVRAAIQHITPLKDSVHQQAVYDSASYMIELAVCDSFFTNCKASSVAMAALLNALEIVVVPNAKLISQLLIKVSSQVVDSIDTIMMHKTRLSCIYNHSVEQSHRSDGPHIIEGDEDDYDVDDDEECSTKYTTSSSIKRECLTVISDDELMSSKRSRMEM